jgi:hypothetical protein
MPSIQDILNVLPGYQSEQQDFNRRIINQSGSDTANEMLLKAIQSVGTGIPAGEPMLLSAGSPKVAPEAVPLPSAPRSNTGYSLSQNIASPAPADDPATAGTPFHYKIYKDGEELGYAHGTVKRGTATVNNIYTDENSLGVQGLKQLREVVRQDFPRVTNFEGYRISGARWGQAASPRE